MPIRKKAILIILIVILGFANACDGLADPLVTPAPRTGVTPGPTISPDPDPSPSPSIDPGGEEPGDPGGDDDHGGESGEGYDDIFSYYWYNPDLYGVQSVDGKLKMGDYDFYGMGVNYYNLLMYPIKNYFSTDTVFYGLEVLAQNNIPFVRFSACPYYYYDMHLYFDNKELYLATLRAIADKAEQLNIGLIPSFFWRYTCIPDYYDEPLRQWGDSGSKTRGFMREFTKNVVSAFKDSKAIWGWEYGNEHNLAVDLPNAAELVTKLPNNSKRTSRTEEDYLKSSDIHDSYKEFASIVRQYDDKNRFIMSGNGGLRPSQYNQHITFGTSWKQDAQNEHKTINAYLNPEGIDTICEHLYFLNKKFFNITDYSLENYVQLSLDHAAELKKPFIIGEFGYSGYEQEEQNLSAIRQAGEMFVEKGVQLAMLWNYAPVGTNVEHSFNESTEAGRNRLKIIEDCNALYADLFEAQKGT